MARIKLEYKSDADGIASVEAETTDLDSVKLYVSEYEYNLNDVLLAYHINERDRLALKIARDEGKLFNKIFK